VQVGGSCRNAISANGLKGALTIRGGDGRNSDTAHGGSPSENGDIETVDQAVCRLISPLAVFENARRSQSRFCIFLFIY
jgi:hypothetical protein